MANYWGAFWNWEDKACSGTVEAKDAQALILEMKFSTYESNVPLSAINRCLHAYANELKKASKEELKNWQDKLLRELNESGYLLKQRLDFLGELLPDFPKPPAMDKDQEEKAFFQAFARLFTMLPIDGKASLIFLDDIQWADSVSINLLHEIACLAKEGRLAFAQFLGAYRSEEVFPDDDVYQKILNVIPEKDHIFLDSLNAEESHSLVELLLDEDDEEVQKIKNFTFSLTEGRPFFIYEFLENAVNNLYYINDDRLWVFDHERAKVEHKNDDLDEMARNRISRLSPDTRSTILAASVVGASIKRSTLCYILEQLRAIEPFESNESIESILERCIHELQIEHMVQNVEDPIIFFHDRVRQAAWALVDDDRKVFLHQKFAAYHFPKVIDHQGDLEASYIFEIAFHVMEGGILLIAIVPLRSYLLLLKRPWICFLSGRLMNIST